MGHKSKKKWKWWAILFWLLLWEIGARLLNQEILLVSPFVVAQKLFFLLQDGRSWLLIGLSLLRVMLGFLLAMFLGILCAYFSHQWTWFQQLAAPIFYTMKSIPVASFVILVLIWVRAGELAFVISFLMGLPIFYDQLLKALEKQDVFLEEMSVFFHISKKKKFRYITLAQILPYFETACSLSIGFCWKAGIAAEVIGLPNLAIGSELHEAKVFLDTTSLFAWTLLIIILSSAMEYLVQKAVLQVVWEVLR
ncbi:MULTISPECIES: ABC transporter permease [Terrabacteria group]|uniref:ABC transporter permease n=1 Tax=Bacillati TaxID=1783272 RepID=UPI001C6E6499|nr:MULTISPECIES: ABC transporter permease subunit [Terrabacteria group]MBW9212710.1 ABC transporter permease subunit [Trueperella sp. zg.1013]